jgi:hypothetical protein
LSAIDARPLGSELQLGGVAGNHIDLAAEAGHPKTVDHVGGLECKGHGRADGNTDFVGAGDLCAVGTRVGDAPPPLLADYFDADRIAVTAEVEM